MERFKTIAMVVGMAVIAVYVVALIVSIIAGGVKNVTTDTDDYNGSLSTTERAFFQEGCTEEASTGLLPHVARAMCECMGERAYPLIEDKGYDAITDEVAERFAEECVEVVY